jgi:microcompartment protein CcmK/EutM
MKLAQVIGTVVLSQCLEPYRGMPLHLIRSLGPDLVPIGDPEVSAAWQAMHEDDVVVVEVSREACNAFSPPVALDSVIIAKADAVQLDDAARRGQGRP